MSAPAAAHSGEWGIFLDAVRSTLGGSLHVRGDLPSTGPIQVVLVGTDPAGILLTTIDDAPNGHFETVVTFPSSIAPGVWAVEARAEGMRPARTSIELVPALPPGGPDEDAPLASPVSASPLAASPLAPLPTPVTTATGVDLVPLAAVALALFGLGLLIFRTRRSTAAR